MGKKLDKKALVQAKLHHTFNFDELYINSLALQAEWVSTNFGISTSFKIARFPNSFELFEKNEHNWSDVANHTQSELIFEEADWLKILGVPALCRYKTAYKI